MSEARFLFAFTATFEILSLGMAVYILGFRKYAHAHYLAVQKRLWHRDVPSRQANVSLTWLGISSIVTAIVMGYYLTFSLSAISR